jgi:hypothetical protein
MANKLDNLKKGDGFDTHPERINKNGRPRKYVSLLKDSGYKLSEINDTIQTMMSMTMDELKEVFDNPAGTILEKTIANAMVKSLKKGSLYSLDTLITRVYGKPKESAEINLKTDYNITLNLGK